MKAPIRCGLAALLLAAPQILVAGGSAAHELPVGDGHITDHPARGNVYACETSFHGGAALHEGSWFHGETWDPAKKPHVEGSVMWPNARLTVTPDGDQLAVNSNGLPLHEATGNFPIDRNDPAYRYDRNPNSIETQNLSFEIPLEPVTAAQPSCVPMGMIGFTVTGVAIYNALDAGGNDAAAHEIQDLCNGHPQANGQYHYHSSSPCLPGANSNKLVGWALDGFPIFGMRDASGAQITNADLDACHGRAESVTIDGRTYAYAYRLTQEYPYTLGCFVGQVERSTQQSIRHALGPPRLRP